MKRREMIKAAFLGGLFGAVRPAAAADSGLGLRTTPITGPDHPLAPRKTLVYGLGATASGILRRNTEEGFIGDYWVTWAGIPDTDAEVDVNLWGTDLYPFWERNMSRLSLLTRLGDVGADLVAPTAIAWRDRVPVDVLLLEAAEGASVSVMQRAKRQWATLSAMEGVEIVRVGRSEADGQRFLDIRSGWNPPETA